MRLISLESNKESFKRIDFNPSGPSFILAKQENPNEHDNTKTYNGVGKSLIIVIINFCLGSQSPKIVKEFQSNLRDWCFTLTININKKDVKIMRSAENPKKIIFDGEELTLTDFNKKMESLCFDIPKDIRFLTYRSLLPFFLRPSMSSYLKHNNPTASPTEYQIQISNAYLLGLDVTLADRKYHLKKEKNDISQAYKKLKNDPIFREFFNTADLAELHISKLNAEIDKLECDLSEFQVADDYYDVVSEANSIKIEIEQLHNAIKLKGNSLAYIARSLDIAPDVTKSEIQKIYEESNIVFQHAVKKNLVDLNTFYKDLTSSRKKRLLEQKQLIEKDRDELNNKFRSLKIQLDSKLQFLNANHALDVFLKISSNLANLKEKRDGLNKSNLLEKEYRKHESNIKQELALLNSKTLSYLEKEQPQTKRLSTYFKEIVKEIYPLEIAGIGIANNDGDNQIRYKIDARIESDSSDGINDAKTFCYDVALLMAGSNHHMEFIFHDSRLFSKTDKTHTNALFKIVKEKLSDKQYIASINQNQFDMLDPDIQKFVTQKTVLVLTDESNDKKLLGIKVKLNYE